MKNKIASIDFSLFITVFMMILIGLMMVYSASYTYAILEYGNATHFFDRQLMWIVLGLIMFFIVSFIPYQLYGKLIAPMVILMLVLLTLVLIPGVGVERNYSTRWLGFGPILFQPSEIAKIIMILYFAKAYMNKRDYIEDFRKGLLPPLILLVVVFALIVLQPDLGTGISLLVACGSILLISAARWHHLFALGAVALMSVILLATSADYRSDRLTSFMDPFADPLGLGFQMVNSYVAIGTGGITGAGIGNSIQKLGFLPEAHTDFIMAIIIEELGILGLSAIVILYMLLLFKGFEIFKYAPDYFGKFIAFGVTIQICFQAVLNLGAVSGLLPITGITLPLISYGGSSMLITLIGLGILMNISMQISQRKKNSERNVSKAI
ncbi:putative lipid II flippase FtsW [Virgibacillus sp. C22-A2]|uniref:Probable peptidoglycan glycosyltransferase FtsW n=1 Tax=Virgibacillus tibetensis TaxID=3042313 RepID=A0ABU6KEZ1_9BACI|nr:putative lipid II flippase FtsW [Virgibacillus sp. C22-A2]